MMKQRQESGFAAIEAMLILIVVAILGFTGWFVWHAKQNAQQSLDNATQSQPVSRQVRTTGFTDCMTRINSKLELSFPEKCTTKEGKTYIDTTTKDKTVIFTTFSRLPAAFKGVYVAHASSEGRLCVNSNGMTTDESGKAYDELAWYITDKFISIGECSSAAIYANYHGTWTFVAMSQDAYSCQTLHKYDVPSNILMRGTDTSFLNECVDQDTNQRGTYVQ